MWPTFLTSTIEYGQHFLVRRCHCPNRWGTLRLCCQSSSSAVLYCLHAPPPFSELDWQCEHPSQHSTLNSFARYLLQKQTQIFAETCFPPARNVGCRAVMLLRFLHSPLAYHKVLCERQEKLAPGRWGCIYTQVSRNMFEPVSFSNAECSEGVTFLVMSFAQSIKHFNPSTNTFMRKLQLEL